MKESATLSVATAKGPRTRVLPSRPGITGNEATGGASSAIVRRAGGEGAIGSTPGRTGNGMFKRNVGAL